MQNDLLTHCETHTDCDRLEADAWNAIVTGRLSKAIREPIFHIRHRVAEFGHHLLFRKRTAIHVRNVLIDERCDVMGELIVAIGEGKEPEHQLKALGIISSRSAVDDFELVRRVEEPSSAWRLVAHLRGMHFYADCAKIGDRFWLRVDAQYPHVAAFADRLPRPRRSRAAKYDPIFLRWASQRCAFKSREDYAFISPISEPNLLSPDKSPAELLGRVSAHGAITGASA